MNMFPQPVHPRPCLGTGFFSFNTRRCQATKCSLRIGLTMALWFFRVEVRRT